MNTRSWKNLQLANVYATVHTGLTSISCYKNKKQVRNAYYSTQNDSSIRILHIEGLLVCHKHSKTLYS